MSLLTAPLIAFACMFLGAQAGAYMRRRMPDEHLEADARDVVRLGAGLIATMAALALGLLVSSARNTFEAANHGLLEGAAGQANLDRILYNYGSEAEAARAQLKHVFQLRMENFWPENGDVKAGIEAEERSLEMEKLAKQIRNLEPENDAETYLKVRAMNVFGEIAKMRWSLIGQTHASIPHILIIVLIFWFTVLLDMSIPFDGLFKVSRSSMENSMTNLGRD
jgi:hypothetical protein